MRKTFELQQFKKCIILFMMGVSCALIGYVIYLIDPVTRIVDHQLTMAPNSMAFNLWRKPPLDVIIYVYAFNITNPAEFLAGKEKLKLEEVGPFVYQENVENKNITWNANGTLTYMPRRTVRFLPEKSIADPADLYVNVPNIPMLGVSSALSSAGFFVNFPFTQLINYVDSKPILNLTLNEYFWGYEDPLVRLASSVVPKYIDFAKFGLLDRMYAEGDNVVNINIKNNHNMIDEMNRYLSIETYNYSPGLANWGYREETNVPRPENAYCNIIKGATESPLLPPKIDKRAKFRVFRKAFCRTLPVTFKREVETDTGLRGYLYQLPDDFLETPDKNPDNECYCRKMDKCLKKGLSDLTPCYYNIPAAMSYPHFMDADPSLLESIDGMKPDREKHTTSIIVQPDFGVPTHILSRVQTNLVMKDVIYNSRLTAFKGLVVPLFWSDLQMPGLPNDVKFLMLLAVKIAPLCQTVIVYLLIITSVICLILCMIGTVLVINQERERKERELGESVDFRLPLENGQYTAIRILPSALRKISSKTSLFS